MSAHLSLARLSAYVEGECAPQQEAEAAAHLAGCSLCRAQHAALVRVEQALTQLGQPEPAPELLGDLRRRLAAPPARSWRWAWGVAAVAAAGALALAVWWPRSVPTPTTTAAGRLPTVTVTEKRPEPPRSELVKVAPGANAPAPVPAVHHPRKSVQPRPRQLPAHRVGPTRTPQTVAAVELARAKAEVAASAPAGPTAMTQQGVILILGDPQPTPASNECHLEVSRPDGTRSVFSQTQSRDKTGQVRTARVSLQNYAAGER